MRFRYSGGMDVDLDRFRIKPGSKVKLSERPTDDEDRFDREAAEARFAENVGALGALQHRLYAEGERGLLVVLQAMDAAGKDSTIRHVFRDMNAQGVDVESFKRPTAEELAHDFLWRIHKVVPAKGFVTIFNRSHYEDVLVVRVNELVPRKVWSRRYDKINAFESHLRDAGTEVIKIYLHISKERQREKLVRRVTDPSRNWKFEASDFDTRRRWDEYMEAYEDAIGRCSTAEAPWYVVPADKKWFRLLVVSEIVRSHMERMDPQFPSVKLNIEDAMHLIESVE